MYVDNARIKELRLARQWTQEQLSQLSGLNLRTIQRIESGAKISNESLRSLAAVFEVSIESLLASELKPEEAALNAMRKGMLNGLTFIGVTTRTDFWWFALGVTMVLALAKILGEFLGPIPFQVASLIVLLPWLAACTRRLRDAGLNPWWQLISLVPVAGFLLLLYLLTTPSKDTTKQP